MTSFSTSTLAMSHLLASHMLTQSSETVSVYAWLMATSVWSNLRMMSQCTKGAVSLHIMPNSSSTMQAAQ